MVDAVPERPPSDELSVTTLVPIGMSVVEMTVELEEVTVVRPVL